MHEFHEINLRTTSKLLAPQDLQEAIRPMRTDKCQRPPGDLAPGICTLLPKRICFCNTRTLNGGMNWQRTHLFRPVGLSSLVYSGNGTNAGKKVVWLCLLQEVTNTALLLLRRLTEALSLKKSAIPANRILIPHLI